MKTNDDLMHNLVMLCGYDSPTQGQRQRMIRLSHMLARSLNVAPEDVLNEACDIARDEACIDKTLFTIKFIDPLSGCLVYDIALHAEHVGDAITRACRIAHARGINVGACNVNARR